MVAVFAAAAVLSVDIFDRVEPFDISDPDSEVVRAADVIENATGQTAEPGVVLIVAPAAAGSGSAAATAAAAAELRAVTGIKKVTSTSSDSALAARDGRMLVLGYLDASASRVEVGEIVDEVFADSPTVTAGGTAVAAYQVGLLSENDTRKLEILAAPILLLLLLLVFRTAIAAVLPLLLASLCIVMTFAVLRLITGLTAIDLFALQTVTGLGTGLAIDYSLFILSRYREEIAAGRSFEAAQERTLDTAGRTVAFSSLTVAMALVSLVVFPQPFLHSTGIAGALTAIFAGLTALVVLPPILALLGPSVNRFAIRRDPHHSDRTTLTFWRRLPVIVCRWPFMSLLLGTVVMALLASQALGISLTTPDARELPPEESARAVSDALPDFAGVPATQLYAVVPANLGSGQNLRTEIASLKTANSVSAPKPIADGFAQITISSAVDPLSEAGHDLVSEVREILPDSSLLGGRAAEQVDQRESIRDHVSLVVAIVVITNLLILVTMTGSLLLPLLAVAMNLFTVAASIGVLVLAFTTELGASLLGTDVQSGIDMSVPVIVFAVGFGLSTDYGIFLFARIREERGTRSDVASIVEGVASTGRLISASALLLAIAVGAFVFSDLVIIKEFAVAIAAAVLLDATVVRGLLIPALLRLLGSTAWRGPRRLGANPG